MQRDEQCPLGIDIVGVSQLHELDDFPKSAALHVGGDTVLASCWAEGYDLSEGMVYTGWALPVERGEERYSRQLEQAKSNGHGLWRGSFVAPWEWAEGQRLPEEKGG